MKDIKEYILETVEDGKNGHWEDFADEDTGEIVSMWVNDPTPEELEAREKEAEENSRQYWEKIEKENAAYKKLNIDNLENTVWNIQNELKDLHQEYRQLQIDQEEEVGGLYTQGKEAEAEKLAQKYGAQFNKNAAEQEKKKQQLIIAKQKLNKAQEEMDKLRNELWG